MKRYLEGGPAYCRLTYVPEGSSKPISVWAEYGPVTDDIIQTFYIVDEHGKRLEAILAGIGEEYDGSVTKPAKLNLDTDKLERVRK